VFNRRDTSVLEAYSCIIGEDNALNDTHFVNGTRDIPFMRHLNMLNGQSYAFSKSYPKRVMCVNPKILQAGKRCPPTRKIRTITITTSSSCTTNHDRQTSHVRNTKIS